MIKKSPAPIGGLNYLTADNRLPETDAKVLDNWIPDTGFCRIREDKTEATADLTGIVEGGGEGENDIGRDIQSGGSFDPDDITGFPANGGTQVPGGGVAFDPALQCQPFTCDAIDVVIPTWANGLLEVTSQFDPDLPAFGDVFPLDGLTPINNSGTITDWGDIQPRALTANETVPVIAPCDFTPVAAVRGTTFNRLTTDESNGFVIYSADGDGAFPPSDQWTMNFDYVSNLGAGEYTVNLFFRDQGDGTARLEFEAPGFTYEQGDKAGESSSYSFGAPAISFTLGGSDNWYVSFVKIEAGTPFQELNGVGTQYWYFPVTINAKLWNMDGDVSSILTQFNVGALADPSNNITVTSHSFDDMQFAFASKRIAAASASTSLATADTDDLILAVLRNRSTYTPPGYCP